MIPLLLNHDHTKVIGRVTVHSSSLVVTFLPEYRITKDQLFKIFGDCGIRVLRATFAEGVTFVDECELLEWSLVV